MNEEKINIPSQETVGRQAEQETTKLQPYKEIISRLGDKLQLSWHRLRRLLNTGVIAGEKRRREGKGRGFPFVWYTSEAAVITYRESLQTPSEYGRKGGRPRKEGKGIGTRGLVFQAG